MSALPPLVLEGDGSVGDPFAVTLVHGGKTGCAGIVACVGQHLGAGLAYDGVAGDIGVDLSADAGNLVEFGSDGGVYSPGPTVPPPPQCGRSVDNLGAFVWGGMNGGAGFIKAYAGRAAVNYANAMRVDFIEVDVGTTLDGVSCPVRQSGQQFLDSLTDLTVPFSYTIADLTCQEWAGARVAHGHPTQPKWDAGFVSGWPKPGGWYGFLEAGEEFQWSLAGWLHAVNREAVAIVSVGTETVTPEQRHITAAVGAIAQECAQAWAMVEVRNLANAQMVIDAGVVPVLRIDSYVVGTTPTPAAVFAAGVRWVVMDYRIAEAQWTAYKTGGLNVVVRTSGRQYHSGRAQALAVRGVLSPDPAYARGAAVDYRRETDTWKLKRRMVGQLNSNTDLFGRDVGYHPVSPSDGSVIWDADTLLKPLHDGLLMGWASPVRADWASFTAVYRARPSGSLGSTSAFGMCVGMPDDRPTYHTSNADIQQPFYACYVRPNGGQIGIEYWDTSGATTLASAAITPFNNQTMDVEMRFSAASIAFRVKIGAGAWTSVSTTNTALRGRYLSLFRNHGNGTMRLDQADMLLKNGIA